MRKISLKIKLSEAKEMGLSALDSLMVFCVLLPSLLPAVFVVEIKNNSLKGINFFQMF